MRAFDCFIIFIKQIRYFWYFCLSPLVVYLKNILVFIYTVAGQSALEIGRYAYIFLCPILYHLIIYIFNYIHGSWGCASRERSSRASIERVTCMYVCALLLLCDIWDICVNRARAQRGPGVWRDRGRGGPIYILYIYRTCPFPDVSLKAGADWSWLMIW